MPSDLTVVLEGVDGERAGSQCDLLCRAAGPRRHEYETPHAGSCIPSLASSVARVTPTAPMTPEAALLRVIHCLDRVHEQGFKVKAFVRALEMVRNTDPVETRRSGPTTRRSPSSTGSATARRR